MPHPPAAVHADVWSDYVCPFCYLELPVLDALQAELGPALHVTWRAFELRPDPVPTLDPGGEYLRTTWARSVYPMAAARGMTLRLPPVQPRSRLALVLAESQRARGAAAFDAVHRALFRAFFEDGRDLADRDVLRDVGREAGLAPAAVDAALDDPAHLAAVLADERLAAELGLDGVPALVLRPAGAPWREGRLVAGAQPLELLRQAAAAVAGAGDAGAAGAVRRRLPLAGP